MADECVIDGRCTHAEHGAKEEDGERQPMLPVFCDVPQVVDAQNQAANGTWEKQAMICKLQPASDCTQSYQLSLKGFHRAGPDCAKELCVRAFSQPTWRSLCSAAAHGVLLVMSYRMIMDAGTECFLVHCTTPMDESTIAHTNCFIADSPGKSFKPYCEASKLDLSEFYIKQDIHTCIQLHKHSHTYIHTKECTEYLKQETKWQHVSHCIKTSISSQFDNQSIR